MLNEWTNDESNIKIRLKASSFFALQRVFSAHVSISGFPIISKYLVGMEYYSCWVSYVKSAHGPHHSYDKLGDMSCTPLLFSLRQWLTFGTWPLHTNCSVKITKPTPQDLTTHNILGPSHTNINPKQLLVFLSTATVICNHQTRWNTFLEE